LDGSAPDAPRYKSDRRNQIYLPDLQVYKQEKPDIVHHFTPKAVIYGSIAAHYARVKKIVNTITGLGYIFSGHSTQKRILQSIVRIMYRVALSNTTVMFQNIEDMQNLVGLEAEEKESYILLGGSGVSLSKFKATPEPDGKPLVLLAARLMEEKGVNYFVEASRILKTQGVDARFVLVGSPDHNTGDSITAVKLRQWVSEGMIEWWGWRNDMEQVYPQAHIVCLPTYYGEGVPKSLIEAAACARPIVATDIPGCRKVVRDGENGLLVPIKDAGSLAGAIKKLLNDGSLRRRMGIRGREIAEKEFSAKQNIAQHFAVYGIPY
jgi:glycosyltransferase involved in cell wall biosynthesis